MPDNTDDSPSDSPLHDALRRLAHAFDAPVAKPADGQQEGYFAVIAIADIQVDESLQARVTTNAHTVDNYADAYIDGMQLPPLILFWDGTYLWIGDGNHRLQGARKAGKATIDCQVRAGSRQDALLHAAGANGDHGLPRTDDDKHKAVNIMLDEPEWRTWTDARIARHCHVSDRFVGLRRKERGELPLTKRLSRSGRVIDTAKMGRPAAKSRKVDAPPQTTLNGAKSNPDDNDSAPPKALTNTSSTQLGSRGAPTKQASSAPVQTEAKTLTLRKGANDNEYSYPLAEVDLYPDGPPSRPADAAVSPPGTVGDEESNGTTIPSGIEPPTAVPSSDEDDYRVKLDALFEVAVRESEVELREANVALRESEVKLREANVALRESEVELREQAVELRESELEHRQHDVD